MTNTPEGQTTRKKMSKGRKIFFVILSIFTIALIFAGVAISSYLNDLNQTTGFENKEEYTQLEEELVEPAVQEEPYYVLILGSDAREGETVSRSDVIMLVRLALEESKVTMVSIPRDTKVEIEGYGTQKINAAYAYGNAAGAVKTVSKFAGVSISHYVEVDFSGVEAIVDSLGGVMIDVPLETTLRSGEVLSPGKQLLNGETALWFVRERKSYERGDFQRADNQKLLLEALADEMLGKSVVELPDIIKQASGYLSTDYSIAELLELAQKLQASENLTIYSATTPSEDMMIDGVSYVVHDEELWEEMMKLVDAGEDPGSLVTDEGPSGSATEEDPSSLATETE